MKNSIQGERMSAKVDLHLHTLSSDGRLTPSQLIDLVAKNGLKIVSITDHDSTEGLAEAYHSAKSYPDLTIIPGIELSTDIPGDEIHMLGYFMNYEDPSFQKTLSRFREGRLERGRLMVEKLATLGIHIEWERVQQIAGDGSVGRPHIALAMVEKGYFKEPKGPFAEYLGRNGKAYVERSKMTPAEGVEILTKVGGVAVLAHPASLSDLDYKVTELKEAGLKGIEVYYAMYSADTIKYLSSIAQKHDLIPCGGSDYHCLGNSGEALPGTLGPPIETMNRLYIASQT